MGLRAHEATASEALRALSSHSEERRAKSKEVEKVERLEIPHLRNILPVEQHTSNLPVYDSSTQSEAMQNATHHTMAISLTCSFYITIPE